MAGKITRSPRLRLLTTADKMFEEFPQKIFQMPSAIALIISNLVPLFGVLFLGWSSAEVLLLFWSESAVIGFFTVVKILRAPIPKTGLKGIKVNGKEVKNPHMAISTLKILLAGFFIFHFGIFMSVHLIFLLFFLLAGSGASFSAAILSFKSVLVGFFLIFASHAFSYLNNYIGKHEYKISNIGTMFWAPYTRVIPMHIAIIFGFILGAPIFVLVFVKIIFDLLAHLAEHNKIQLQKINGRSK